METTTTIKNEMKTFKQLLDEFNHNWKTTKGKNWWVTDIIKPIVDNLEMLLKMKAKDKDDLRSFGLRAHVPVTFEKDGREIYFLDFGHSLESGEISLTDFEAPKNKEYKDGTIGAINGMNYQQIYFSANLTAKAIAKYIKANPDKFTLKN